MSSKGKMNGKDPDPPKTVAARLNPALRHVREVTIGGKTYAQGETFQADPNLVDTWAEPDGTPVLVAASPTTRKGGIVAGEDTGNDPDEG